MHQFSNPSENMTAALFEPVYNHPKIQKDDYKSIKMAHTKVEFKKNDVILKGGKVNNEYY